MEQVLRMLFVVLVAVTGMIINHDISTRAQTLHYLKEDLEIAVHDAALEIDQSELANGRIVFQQSKAMEVFRKSFEKNSGLSSSDYEIVEIAFLDHSTVSSFPFTYRASSVEFEDVFVAPTMIAFIKASPSAYFTMAADEPFIQVASYTYKMKNDGIYPFPNEILGTPNGQGFIWPVPHTRNITSPFGMRENPVSGINKLHAGVDIASADVDNTAVVAAKDGTVIYAGWISGYGNIVIINHGNGLETRYAHLSTYLINSGESVSAGQVIGKVGSTGNSTGPHLHFETRVNGKPYDPLRFYE
jgi:murein DD-endopeptidase MepM/ murein hydrolase activator NlpD